MFSMSGVLEFFSQVNERPRSLDQAFKKVIVRGVRVQPKLLQNVVRLVIKLLVPTTKIGAIERMIRDLACKSDRLAFQLADELRNPFAFVHEALNFIMPPILGKLSFISPGRACVVER